jgi:hypothetical protein
LTNGRPPRRVGLFCTEAALHRAAHVSRTCMGLHRVNRDRGEPTAGPAMSAIPRLRPILAAVPPHVAMCHRTNPLSREGAGSAVGRRATPMWPPSSSVAPRSPHRHPVGIAQLGSAMTYHPHVHMIVPGGGLSMDDSRWISHASQTSCCLCAFCRSCFGG